MRHKLSPKITNRVLFSQIVQYGYAPCIYVHVHVFHIPISLNKQTAN